MSAAQHDPADPDSPRAGTRSNELSTPIGELDPKRAVAEFRRAEDLLERRRPLDALRALAPLLETEHAAASVHLLAARAYLASAQFQRAEEGFLRVLELDPSDHYARFALGRTLQRQSRLIEARTQLRMAAAMDPRPEYQEALGEVSANIAVRSDRAGGG